LFLRSVTTTTTSDVGLTASTSYSYMVRAYDRSNNFSGYSLAATATTPACVDTTPPSVPATVTATPPNCNEIAISWTPSTDNAPVGSYNVYVTGAFLPTVTPPATSAKHTSLAAGTSHSYTVSAVDTAGNQSAQSAASSAITPNCVDTTAPTVPTGL